MLVSLLRVLPKPSPLPRHVGADFFFRCSLAVTAAADCSPTGVAVLIHVGEVLAGDADAAALPSRNSRSSTKLAPPC